MMRTYEICVQGLLDPEWAEWFEGFTLTHRLEGVTVLVGPVLDQSALHGLIHKISNLGLMLISINQIDHHADGVARTKDDPTEQGQP
jgi:hypothetical protein